MDCFANRFYSDPHYLCEVEHTGDLQREGVYFQICKVAEVETYSCTHPCRDSSMDVAEINAIYILFHSIKVCKKKKNKKHGYVNKNVNH